MIRHALIGAVLLAFGTGCTLDLHRRPDLIPFDFTTLIPEAGPCTVTLVLESGIVTINVGEATAFAVQEATTRAVKALEVQGVTLPPILVALAAGVAKAGADAALCRSFGAGKRKSE